MVTKLISGSTVSAFVRWSYAVTITSPGFIGFAVPSFQAHFTPCLEIGWRLAADCWGQGLATEGGRRMVEYASEQLGLGAVVSFTVPANVRF
jgi:RimJ/RimL family protein N-acetyltransferase